MAYEPTEWKDRVVEKPRTYTLQNNPDGTVTLIPAPGSVLEKGTPVNAANLNKLEQGLKTHEAENVSHWHLISTITTSVNTQELIIDIPVGYRELRLIGSKLQSTYLNINLDIKINNQSLIYNSTVITGASIFAGKTYGSINGQLRDDMYSDFILHILGCESNKIYSMIYARDEVSTINGYAPIIGDIDTLSVSTSNIERVMLSGATFEVWGR